MIAIMSKERSAPMTVTTMARKVAGHNCGHHAREAHAPGPVGTSGLDLLGGDIVQPGEIQDHAIAICGHSPAKMMP